jgi:hypothetical protein
VVGLSGLATPRADVHLPSRRTCATVAQKCVFKIDRITEIDCATAGNTG